MTAIPRSPADRYTVELLQALAAGAPRLPGARCRQPENRAIFDRTINRGDGLRTARAAAIKICQSCPPLDACRRYYIDSMDECFRPFGVTAGQVTKTRTDRTAAHSSRRRTR